jgi:chorismate--pyruvate lyase
MDESDPSMAQPSNIGLAVDSWRPVTTWPAVERPPALWEWLTHTGSLTQKLRALAKDAFHVQVLKETGIELATGDAQLLGVPPGSAAQLREVYLCGAQPLVFGRTLAAKHAAVQWLEQLGARPLGDRVFAEQDAMRGEIEVRQVTASEALYQAAVCDLPEPPSMLWARRSVLSVQTARLLIYECFLPGVDT